MSLVCIAIVGKENSPLYLRDFDDDESSDSNHSVVGEDEDDPFGFSSAETTVHESSSLQHQIMLHASLDMFEELTNPSNEKSWRSPGATGSDAMWVGLLCQIEGMRIYGFLTCTNIKIIAMINDGADSGAPPPARDSQLKSVFATLHDLFVQHTLNPFSKLKEKISSVRFDNGVNKCVLSFNEKQTHELFEI
mmetsp:Transcript_733/g.1348  ORF Transcript_733/g.1348 Transcript_733/m.1348 type:complete len:192 (-) Transcript_733:397-972(-)